ncbi:hypothetical protein PMAC_000361 [Pneumocystis sp. 'macacae']|nr:hypothetical protein PMAC_000361 [Pneumocystis sp. 'macacae']
MEVLDELLISVYYFLSKSGFSKTAKIFAEETGKKELFLQKKEIKSLIEVYNLYNKGKDTEKHLYLEKTLSEVISSEKIKEKKKKIPKNTQIERNNEVKKRKLILSCQEIPMKKSKKQKNGIKNEYLKNRIETETPNTHYVEKGNEIYFENASDLQPNKKEITCDLNFKETYDKENLDKKKDIKGKLKKKSFSRIDKSKIEFAHNCLRDNSYAMAYKGEQDEYGTKANRDLIFTKGKEFRAEKSKKKKGSYHGGKINTNISRSFKFT